MAKRAWLSLPLEGGGTREFNTRDSFREWIAEVRESWAPVLSPPTQRPRSLLLARDTLSKVLNQLTGIVGNGTGVGSPEEAEAIRVTTLDKFPSGAPFAPNDPVRTMIRQRYGTVGHAEAIALGAVIYSALQRASGGNIDLNDVAHPMAFEGMALAAVARDVGGRDFGPLLQRTVSAAEARVATVVEKANSDIQHLTEQLGDAVAAGQEAIAEEVGRSETASRVAVGSITDTEERFKELMRLKAPVDYWATKAAEHRASVGSYRGWIIKLTAAFVPLLAAVYAGGWVALDAFTTRHASAAVAMTLYVAGFVGAVTAIMLWFIRIVVRLYMSQHHLMADAEERASFLRTYLSLTESGKVSEAERALVLASVFRPVPDGIVKDDGAPALSPASILAGALDRR